MHDVVVALAYTLLPSVVSLFGLLQGRSNHRKINEVHGCVDDLQGTVNQHIEETANHHSMVPKEKP